MGLPRKKSPKSSPTWRSMPAGRPRCRPRKSPTPCWSKKKMGAMTMANDVVVGFIGLGTMGGKMATNILKAGYKVVVHDLHRQSASHHLQAGAEWADTPRALAEKSDVIFTSLPEPADVERVSLGADGL